MAAGKGRSAGGGQVGEERQREMQGPGGPDERQENQEEKSGKPWAQGWMGRKTAQAGGGRGISEIWPKEGVKWKRDRERYSPLSLFEFVVLIDNTAHFFCMGGGGGMIQHKCDVNLWK